MVRHVSVLRSSSAPLVVKTFDFRLSTPAAFTAAIPKGQMESAWSTWPAPLVLQLHVAAQVAPMLHLADKLQERITAVSNSCVMALSLLGVQMHLAGVQGSRDETYGEPG